MNEALNKNTTQLCPNCKTGLETYLLDNRGPICPYISYHDGATCFMFKPLLHHAELK